MNRSYEVTGMTCSHCVAAVTAEVSRLAGVNDVTVDLASGRLTISSDEALTVAAVAEAVDEAGYALRPGTADDHAGSAGQP